MRHADRRQRSVSGKREDYLSWEQYFMSVALLSGQRSKDPNTQVGACIVDPRRRIVAVGYAGFPRGASDDELPWAREGAPLETKYPFVCHAELNAILNRNSADLAGCTLYTTAEPCAMCAGAIYWANIGRVAYAMTEARLLELTGSDAQNPTFALPCRTVFAAGQKDIAVLGPFPDVEDEAAAVHEGYWDAHRPGGVASVPAPHEPPGPAGGDPLL